MKKIGLYLLLFLSFNLNGQDKIDPKNFNYDLLSQLITDDLSLMRTRKRLDSLTYDKTLDDAAADHAKYMAENNLVTHLQKSKIKRTPFDRVIFYKGTHSNVYELVQVQPIAKLFDDSNNKLTYQKLNKEIIDKWKGSKEDYEIIQQPGLQVTTCKMVIKEGNLFICVLLSSKPFVENYNFQKGNEFAAIVNPDCFSCKRAQKKLYKDQAFIGWYTVSNDSLYYWNVNYYSNGKRVSKRNLARIFGRGGKIAIDVVYQDQFNCNGSTIFHNEVYHDGYYLGTIDKKSLANDLNSSPAVVQIYVGQIPEFPDTFYQVDFNYLKKENYCMNNMTIYVNPDFLKPTEYFTIPNPEISRDKKIILEDSVEVKINYERGQTDEDTTIFQELITSLDSLKSGNHHIIYIHFTGVASIEGSEETNEKLFRKRGALVASYLKKYYPELEMKSDFFENFDEFRTGLAALGYKDIINYSDDSLRMWANQHRNETTIKTLLNDTRYSSVVIFYRDEIQMSNDAYGFSAAHVQDLIEEKNFRQVIPLYEVLANKAINGDVGLQDSLLNLSIPNEKGFELLHWYQFVLELNVSPQTVTAERLNELKELGAIPTDEDYLEYRLLFNIFNGNEDINVEDFGEITAETKQKKQKAWIESLELISGVENGRYSDKMVVPILLNNVIKMKFDVKQTYFICQYLIYWGYTTEPYIMLTKFAKMPGQIPKLYKQYIKLGYFLKQFDNKKEWKKIYFAMKNLVAKNPDEFCDLFKWHQMGVRALSYKEVSELFCEYCR